jgi:predicted ATPase/DNA-binding CsgD family transcriptional regulator
VLDTAAVMSEHPYQLTTFIGRETELAEVLGAARRSRLVTLIGTGGVGKTRLAIEAARRLAENEIDSIYFVDLAPLREPDLLERTVIVALGGSQDPGSIPLETIVELLAAPRSLVLFDNCEHLIDPVARLSDRLLRSVPGLHVLTTSREPLDIAGEARYTVPPLSEEDGVRLFMERAHSVDHRLALTQETRSTVMQLCRGLDGLPLAIELAAARAGQMPIGEIVSRLDDRFALLTKSGRTAEPRHQTLHAAISWSYDLLTSEERAAFACLSVFVGGFDTSAAEAVAACSFDVLGRLADKSIVVVGTGVDGRSRYRLLETLRQYAHERLEESGKADAVKGRHFERFAALAKKAAAELQGPAQVFWMDRLEEELANLRAGLEWARAHDADAALTMAVDLIWFWHHRVHFAEGRSWLRELASIAPSPRPEILAAALTQAADFAFLIGDRATAALEHDRALELWRRLGDPAGVARALIAKGIAESSTGAEMAERRLLFDEAVREARRAGKEHLVVEGLVYLGRGEEAAGNPEKGRAHLEEAEAIARRTGDIWRLGWVVMNRGQHDRHQGRLEAASARFAEGLELGRSSRSSFLAVMGYTDLGSVRLAQNLEAEARQHFEAALTLEGVTPHPGAMAGLGQIAARRGNFARALTLHGASWKMPFQGWRRELWPVADLESQSWIGAARHALGPEAADIAWRSGGAMTMHEAVAYALSDADEPPAPDSPLTSREQEIAARVARGYRNREIADQLHISPRTVEAHVEHIRNKLGYQSRSQVAAWANEHGLVKGQ